MTTWLSACILLWVVLCTVVIALDPMFNSNSPHVGGGDRLLGGIVGFLFGCLSGAVIYTTVRVAAWLLSVW